MLLILKVTKITESKNTMIILTFPMIHPTSYKSTTIQYVTFIYFTRDSQKVASSTLQGNNYRPSEGTIASFKSPSWVL